MYKMTPGVTVGKLQIAMSAQSKTLTNVTIAYEFTSLGPPGDTYLEGFTAEWVREVYAGLGSTDELLPGNGCINA